MTEIHRKRRTIEAAADYTGYPASILHEAFKRGQLHGERPGLSMRSRIYFDEAELDRWLDAIKVGAE